MESSSFSSEALSVSAFSNCRKQERQKGGREKGGKGERELKETGVYVMPHLCSYSSKVISARRLC